MTRYRGRISGPLLDRIDLQIEVPAVPQEELQRKSSGEASAGVRARTAQAYQTQIERQDKPNSRLGTGEIDRYCEPDTSGAALLKQAITRLNLSARAYHRILKVARTIADLASETSVASQHVAEAIQYRKFDRT